MEKEKILIDLTEESKDTKRSFYSSFLEHIHYCPDKEEIRKLCIEGLIELSLLGNPTISDVQPFKSARYTLSMDEKIDILLAYVDYPKIFEWLISNINLYAFSELDKEKHNKFKEYIVKRLNENLIYYDFFKEELDKTDTNILFIIQSFFSSERYLINHYDNLMKNKDDENIHKLALFSLDFFFSQKNVEDFRECIKILIMKDCNETIVKDLLFFLKNPKYNRRNKIVLELILEDVYFKKKNPNSIGFRLSPEREKTKVYKMLCNSIEENVNETIPTLKEYYMDLLLNYS